MAWFIFNKNAFTTYRAVQQDDLRPSSNIPKHPSQNSHKIVGILVFLASLIGLGLYIVALPTELAVQSPEATLETSCGFSVQEARERGCQFNMMSFSWLPNEYYNQELIQNFESLREWHYTEEVTRAKVVLREADALFVSFKYHRAQYVFIWEKLHRALGKGGFVDSYIGNYNHTSYCAYMLLMEVENSLALNTQILRKFPTCSPATTDP
ncbi:hypothetical protein F5883DRAFT_421296 [Diaporthe sp. PMI_573]|nr:hypothetical protein F5883DRAFT_421296 [Diaporthaceae sp. PMI_573]